jgi:hypothetical protein
MYSRGIGTCTMTNLVFDSYSFLKCMHMYWRHKNVDTLRYTHAYITYNLYEIYEYKEYVKTNLKKYEQVSVSVHIYMYA